jgi:hypothetical protein
MMKAKAVPFFYISNKNKKETNFIILKLTGTFTIKNKTEIKKNKKKVKI